MADILLRLPFDGDFPVSLPFGAIPDNPAIVEKFRQWGIAGHHGLDFALPLATPVVAAESGQVIQAGDNGDWGLSVTLAHPWGQSLYAHLSEARVTVGQEVKAGTFIGLSGQSGASFGPHLHFGIKPRDSDPNNGFLGFIDPAPFLSPLMPAPSSPPPPPASPPASPREVPVSQLIEEILKKRLLNLRSLALAARRQKKETILNKIVEMAATQPVTNRILRERFHLSRQTVSNYLKGLTTAGHLKRNYRGKYTTYTS